MNVIAGVSFMVGVLLVGALMATAPVIMLVLFAGKRLSLRLSRFLVAAGFGGATLYWLWRFDRFDVWRHGIPPFRYLLVYGAYATLVGAIGWFVGALIYRERGDTRAA